MGRDMGTVIADVVTCEAFRGDVQLVKAAVWALGLSGDGTYRQAVLGLKDGTLTPEQATAAEAALYELAHELDVVTSASRSLPA